MKLLWITLAAHMFSQPFAMAEDLPLITIIDSSTPTKVLIAKPGTYLGETFTFTENHSGNVQVQIGVWEAGMGQHIIDNFPFTEYVSMISGSVIVTEKNGDSMTFKVGDTFVIPKGWSGVWDVQERMKKQIVRIGSAVQ